MEQIGLGVPQSVPSTDHSDSLACVVVFMKSFMCRLLLLFNLTLSSLSSGHLQRVNFQSGKKSLVITYKVSSVRSTAEFAAEIIEDKRQQDDIYNEFKEIEYQPKILYPEKMSFKMETLRHSQIKKQSNKLKKMCL